MKVLIASSEAIPFAKTGGLADVAGTLTGELRGLGVDARLIMPLYRSIKDRFEVDDTGIDVEVPLGPRTVSSRIFTYKDVNIFLECEEFFDREELYGTPAGDYSDNAFRFIFFSKALVEASLALGFIPDVIHCNDWQTGLTPLLAKTLYRKKLGGCVTLLTIHNLGYQGLFPESAMTLTGLGPGYFTRDVLEYYGNVSLLKAGITTADAVSTVSENYAMEIMEPEQGFGFEGVLKQRAHDLYGIRNGIDCSQWDPSTDKHITSRYSTEDISGKKRCREYLARACNFQERSLPLVGIVGRLSPQKGLDIFLEAAGEIVSQGANMVVLGKGEEQLHKGMRDLFARFPGNISVNIGFDEALSHAIYAGSDMLLIPSRYEPCGLTQMIAMRYGTIPVARATGGLKDTIEDYNALAGRGTGFLFVGTDPSTLAECYKRALCVYSDGMMWRRLVEMCMKEDFSWKQSALKYIALYSRISGRRVAR